MECFSGCAVSGPRDGKKQRLLQDILSIIASVRRSGSTHLNDKQGIHNVNTPPYIYTYESIAMYPLPSDVQYPSQASPREGKYGRKRGAARRTLGRAAAVKDTGRFFRGVKVPSDAFNTACTRRNDLDALPGELESLIFPQRYPTPRIPLVAGLPS